MSLTDPSQAMMILKGGKATCPKPHRQKGWEQATSSLHCAHPSRRPPHFFQTSSQLVILKLVCQTLQDSWNLICLVSPGSHQALSDHHWWAWDSGPGLLITPWLWRDRERHPGLLESDFCSPCSCHCAAASELSSSSDSVSVQLKHELPWSTSLDG